MRLTAPVFAVAALFATNATLAQANCTDDEIIIKFSHVTNTDKHPKGIAASLLQKRVNEEMDGVACMEVYPNSTLHGDETEMEALLNNDIQMVAPSLAKLETFTRQFRLFDLPFLFDDIDAVDRFQNSETGQALLDSMQTRGLQGLAFWHNGMKQLSADKPLLLPQDAKGLKFRVQQSDVLVAQFEALDASPQKMAFAEVYGALQTGVVDGQENSWSNIYGKKFFEVQDGITETDHGVLDYLVATNTEWWEGLEPDVRDTLTTIISEVTVQGNADSYAVNQENKEAIIKAGGVVRQLSDSQRQTWVDVLKPVWDQFEEDIGSDVLEAARQANRS